VLRLGGIQIQRQQNAVEGRPARLLFILSICGLFIDTVSSSDYIASDDGMINELERIWKEAVVV
jgi:hypothetical protein